MKKPGSSKTKTFLEEKTSAFLELGIILCTLMTLTTLSIAADFVHKFNRFLTASYGPYVTEVIINIIFILLTTLLWVTYRRWQKTSRKVAEFKVILSSISPDVMLTIGPDRKILMCNDAVKKMFGYEQEEILSQSTDFLYEDRRTEAGSKEISESLEKAGFHIGEASGKKKNGETVHLEIITGKLTGQSGAVLLLRDITERKRLEEELRQSQKMEAIGKLSGGIAHDFNNLMTIITCYIEVLAKKWPADQPIPSEIEAIKMVSGRTEKLTNQLLAFSRKQIIHPVILDLNSLLLNFEQMLRRLINENIQLVTNFTREASRIKADSTQIEQVIVNLVVNAKDALPEGGEIRLTTENISVIKNSPLSHVDLPLGDYVLLTVRDNGTGMTEETRKHLFEPFFTTKEKGKGSGLGLATSYGIIRQAGGRIFVESLPQKGTTVKVYLPLSAEQQKTAPEPETVKSVPQGTESILVVEDESMVRKAVCQILLEYGYKVHEAGNGLEALKFLEENPSQKIDLIITDIVMPCMGGKELSHRIRKTKPEIRFLFTSGYISSTIVHQELINSGAFFLPKPFSPQNLSQKVQEVLKK